MTVDVISVPIATTHFIVSLRAGYWVRTVWEVESFRWTVREERREVRCVGRLSEKRAVKCSESRWERDRRRRVVSSGLAGGIGVYVQGCCTYGVGVQ